jgi:hypothetical protein
MTQISCPETSVKIYHLGQRRPLTMGETSVRYTIHCQKTHENVTHRLSRNVCKEIALRVRKTVEDERLSRNITNKLALLAAH